MEKDIKKQLTLKYKQVQRLIKEYNSYTKEIDKIKLKLAGEEEAQVEEYYIKKSKEYLKESEDTRNAVEIKVKSYLEELVALVSGVTSDDTKELEEYKTASEVIESGLALFNKPNDAANTES